MTYCPFQRPETQLAELGSYKIPALVFSQHEGFTYFRQLQRIPSDNSFRPWKSPAFSNLIYVKSGEIRIQVPDKGILKADSSQWMLVSALTQPLRLSLAPNTRLHWLQCDHNVWKSLEADSQQRVSNCRTMQNCLTCLNRQEAVVLAGEQSVKIRTVLNSLESMEGKSALDRLSVASLSYDLLAATLLTDKFQQTPRGQEPCLRGEDLEALEAAARFLENNLDADHSLQKLSRRFYLNEFKLKKGFKARFQNTVFGYLRQKRMEYARDILLQGEFSVLEIATQVGYANPSHFSRAFRETYGMNPGEYRRNQLVTGEFR